ncbi:myb-related transcription factor, partner of profilin-like [Polyodon spathula]|uniref:myb-related transcription factor, partner of profilin-like n=1 Tax=Polyodon spathula TaxID=7913 RepID=UPI001B7DEF23|nr:myb-related transcription factor, partner of profilin-like [Polyodon spathula]XP_041082060.1 myb-related transcription factor, partner of profilin-like [Polyodon spathula]XP_041082061.1 myb-related transcription factor, partner of profilin-like [Polyodon spathula]XP_041082062.1 myb-related transcription factor, partner of profilin-like [Polyodon spathula]XP_041082063.1 myb-related transcription factor, partner of profilin-like [Polyodon spathula]XP_041082065.1 myb-related transcription fact
MDSVYIKQEAADWESVCIKNEDSDLEPACIEQEVLSGDVNTTIEKEVPELRIAQRNRLLPEVHVRRGNLTAASDQRARSVTPKINIKDPKRRHRFSEEEDIVLKEAVALRHNQLYGRESCRLGRGGKKKLWQEIASHVNNVAEHRRKPDDVRRRFEFIRNKLRSRAGRLVTGGVSQGSAVPNGSRSPDTTSDELASLEEELLMGVSSAVDTLTEWCDTPLGLQPPPPPPSLGSPANFYTSYSMDVPHQGATSVNDAPHNPHFPNTLVPSLCNEELMQEPYPPSQHLPQVEEHKTPAWNLKDQPQATRSAPSRNIPTQPAISRNPSSAARPQSSQATVSQQKSSGEGQEGYGEHEVLGAKRSSPQPHQNDPGSAVDRGYLMERNYTMEAIQEARLQELRAICKVLERVEQKQSAFLGAIASRQNEELEMRQALVQTIGSIGTTMNRYFEHLIQNSNSTFTPPEKLILPARVDSPAQEASHVSPSVLQGDSPHTRGKALSFLPKLTDMVSLPSEVVEDCIAGLYPTHSPCSYPVKY